MRILIGTAFFLVLGIHSIAGQISLADIFTDSMVLQRDHPIHFWGKGIPDKTIHVQFSGEKRETLVRRDSSWQIQFKKQHANPVPRSVEITDGTDKITLSNILIGDIWLCIGQSNMEWPMENEQHFEDELQNADQPMLRFYNASYAGQNIYNEVFTDSVLKLLNKRDFFKGNWAVSDSISIRTMSAVGYYFGKEISKKEKVPIGLINMAIGGAPIETFIGRKSLKDDFRLSGKVKGNWLANDELPIWIRERGKQNVGSLEDPPGDTLGPNHAFKPGFAFSAGIAPITQMPIKGILWYQGESNAQEIERVKEYGELQKLMIADYRTKWKQPQMPFYWVQLSSIDSFYYKSQYWPEFRNEQRKLLDEIEYGGMAVTSDIGAKNDVHPPNKRDVGKRLARWALSKTYGKNGVPSGPLPISAEYKNDEILLNFKYTANGLTTADEEKVSGFSLDGKQEVPAKLNANTVQIKSPEKPEFVYYGWQPYSLGNLVNSEEIPASTFKLKIDNRNLQDNLKWHSLNDYTVRGKIKNPETQPFQRLPESMQSAVRPRVWQLSRNAAGLYLEFRTTSPNIEIAYQVEGEIALPHMPATGVSGVDLYGLEKDGSWTWARGNYSFGDTISYRFKDLKPTSNNMPRCYRLYLPLYNTVKWMKLGISGNAQFKPTALDGAKKPIIVYGTSIAQGACASRPGMAWTGILGRKMQRQVINLGFSGNGRLEPEITAVMSKTEASVYILDCMPNFRENGPLGPKTAKKRLKQAVLDIRKKHPRTPIMIVEHAGYSDGGLQPARERGYSVLNAATRDVFEEMTNEKIANLYLLTKEEIDLGIDSFVDGTHPNDHGMLRYAEAYLMKIMEIER